MTYAELVANISSWLHRSDMASMAPTFIALAEERFNRSLRCNAFSAIATATVLNGTSSVELPADYLEGRALTDSSGNEWQQVTPEMLAKLRATESDEHCFAVLGGSIHIPFAVTANTDLELTYWTKVPPLTGTNTTNWLSLNHPGIYLSASLAEACVFLEAPERGAVMESRTAGLMAELKASEQFSGYFIGSMQGNYVV